MTGRPPPRISGIEGRRPNCRSARARSRVRRLQPMGLTADRWRAAQNAHGCRRPRLCDRAGRNVRARRRIRRREIDAGAYGGRAARTEPGPGHDRRRGPRSDPRSTTSSPSRSGCFARATEERAALAGARLRRASMSCSSSSASIPLTRPSSRTNFPALDASIQAQILNLMRDLQERLGLTYLLITHNLAVVRFMATRVGVMYLGRLVKIGETDALFASPRHPYTRMLLDAVPDLSMSGRARTPIGGEPPNPIDPPPGCPFHPRCPKAIAICKSERPLFGDNVACHLAGADEPGPAGSEDIGRPKKASFERSKAI